MHSKCGGKPCRFESDLAHKSLFRKARREVPSTRVFSGLMNNGPSATPASGNLKAFLTKPHTAEELLTTLHRVLHSEGSN